MTSSATMRPLLTSLLYNAPLPIDHCATGCPARRRKELLSHAQHDLFSVVRKHFDDQRIRTLFTSYMHVITTENVPGSGIVFPAIFANVDGVHAAGRRRGELRRALRRVIEAAAARSSTGSDVKEIVCKNGRATGVDLRMARRSRRAASSPARSMRRPRMRMAGEDLFPEQVRQKLKSWHWGNHSLVTLHLALASGAALPRARVSIPISPAPSTSSSAWTTSTRSQCFDDCAAKKLPDVLMGNGACNSAFDPTYAPAGRPFAFWWPFAPYAVDGDPAELGRRKAIHERGCSKCGANTRHNLDDDNIRASYLFTPLDVERLNVNMVQGAVRMGAYIPSQLGINRPHPLLSGTRTPVEGLYLCGSSTGNGGGINGAPATSRPMRSPTT